MHTCVSALRRQSQYAFITNNFINTSNYSYWGGCCISVEPKLLWSTRLYESEVRLHADIVWVNVITVWTLYSVHTILCILPVHECISGVNQALHTFVSPSFLHTFHHGIGAYVLDGCRSSYVSFSSSNPKWRLHLFFDLPVEFSVITLRHQQLG